ncbi:MAG TPA: glycosyltransferase [Acidobacteriota bacterium]|nr:glycosyltransferase [Acidobacteriota bacterium]
MLSGRLRVVHIITKLELGGAQQNTLHTVRNLNRSLFDPHLITGKGGVLDEEAQQLADVSVHFCDSLVRSIHPWKDAVAYRHLLDLLVRLKPQIVHTHSSKAGILGRIAAAAAKVPVIVHTYHGFGFHRFQNPIPFRLYAALEKRVNRKTHHLIFVSEANRVWAEKLGLLQGTSASLIRSGIEFQPFLKAEKDDELRSSLGIPAGAKLVGMIACLKPQKDPLTFAKAADRILQERNDIYFILVGDGRQRGAVARYVRKMKHSNHFLLIGWRRDIPKILPNLDVLVLTSLWEGLPRVLVEAAVAGVPAVASDIDGNREIIVKSKNGILAEPGDARDFARKIIQSLSQPAKVNRETAPYIREEFNIDEMVCKQEKLYLSLISALSV